VAEPQQILKSNFGHFTYKRKLANLRFIFTSKNKKHLKNVGPIRYCEPPLHCQSPGVASRTPDIAITQVACDVHNDDNDNA